MPSTFPAILSSGAGAPFPELDPGFTPWDEFSSLFDPAPTLPKPSLNPYSYSGSLSGSGKDPNEPESIIEERKRKRKLSNRLSARRSRMRKLKSMESLVSHVNRLKFENRELTNRFRIVNHHLLFTNAENRSLWDECVILRRRLNQITHILYLMQLQSNPNN